MLFSFRGASEGHRHSETSFLPAHNLSGIVIGYIDGLNVPLGWEEWVWKQP